MHVQAKHVRMAVCFMRIYWKNKGIAIPDGQFVLVDCIVFEKVHFADRQLLSPKVSIPEHDRRVHVVIAFGDVSTEPLHRVRGVSFDLACRHTIKLLVDIHDDF